MNVKFSDTDDVANRGSSVDRQQKKEPRGRGVSTNARPSSTQAPKSRTPSPRTDTPSRPRKQEAKNSREAVEQDTSANLGSGIRGPGQPMTDTNEATLRPSVFVMPQIPAAAVAVAAMAVGVLVAMTALGFEVRGVAAASLAAGLVIAIIRASAKRHEICGWLRHVAEQWTVVAGAKSFVTIDCQNMGVCLCSPRLGTADAKIKCPLVGY